MSSARAVHAARAVERALVDRAADGDVQAFDELVRRYRPAVFDRCVRILRNPDTADDVAQETFIRAYRYLPSFDRARPFWPWIATIARHLALNALADHRRLRLHADRPARVRCSETDVTVEAFATREEHARLGTALRTLPDRQRRVLLLHALEGWSLAQIASAECSSISSVKNTMYRARVALRKAYENGLLALLPLAHLLGELGRKGRAAGTQVRDACVQRGCHVGELVGQGISVAAQHAVLAPILMVTVAAVSASPEPATPVAAVTQAAAVAAPDPGGAPSGVPRTIGVIDSAVDRAVPGGDLIDYDLAPVAMVAADLVRIVSRDAMFTTALISSPGGYTSYDSTSIWCFRDFCRALLVAPTDEAAWPRVSAHSPREGHVVLRPIQSVSPSPALRHLPSPERCRRHDDCVERAQPRLARTNAMMKPALL